MLSFPDHVTSLHQAPMSRVDAESAFAGVHLASYRGHDSFQIDRCCLCILCSAFLETFLTAVFWGLDLCSTDTEGFLDSVLGLKPFSLVFKSEGCTVRLLGCKSSLCFLSTSSWESG
jgi:hypothetical protein